MVDEVRESVRVDEVMTVEKSFVPEPPIADVDTPLLKDNAIAKRDFLLAINATRLGIYSVTVMVGYEIQVGDEDPRIADKDYIMVEGTSPKVHIGVMTAARNGQKGPFYIRIADVLRSNGLKTGWTSMRATGIKSFKILQIAPGPVLTQPLNMARAQ
jgi:hypothetical protein